MNSDFDSGKQEIKNGGFLSSNFFGFLPENLAVRTEGSGGVVGARGR